ncbi:MAG: primosomal protein N' [Alistipes sp.]
MPLYADIILPLSQPSYTFAVAEDMPLTEGQSVAVQFGHNKIYTGIVWRIHDQRPNFKTIKPVSKVLYREPLLNAPQRALWEWIADYYMCSLGEVMRVALPALMKPSGNSEAEFAEDEFRPRSECYIALSEALGDETQLNELFEKLARRAPKQYEALLEIAAADESLRIDTGEVPRRLLQAERAVLYALEKKGYIITSERERTIENNRQTHFRLPVLTPLQTTALTAMHAQFDGGLQTILLHGITGSGKTEIYIHLIAETLAAGGDVLLLVPEIALTAQLIERMECIFGSRVTPYHSKLSARKRTETYLRLNGSSGGEFVVGVRSSIFLPLKRLQLIIVDEEHDASYKQAEPAPRYNARDCAVFMARLFGARTVLGSATPSLETWLNAQSGKYGTAQLNERYGEAQPPEVVVSDTLRAVKRGERKAHFNKTLLDRIDATLARGQQVMLFQNRRGFSPYVECRSCGWTARCPDCNVSLTLHKQSGKLVCHYCGHMEPIPARCPACKVGEVSPMGFGTEKVEEEIQRIFPAARIVRLDRDTVTSERAFNQIITGFARHDYDIMVGTQMITKGFDFGELALVGILNADNLLNNPDFRATERAFQLMTQVAGRAGRRAEMGEVVIQTTEPTHPVIQQVVTGDFAAMARVQLAERELFFYPPYARLIALTLRHRDPALLSHAAGELATQLRTLFGRRVLGPMAPPVDRIRGEYLVGLLLKVESGTSFARARKLLAEQLAALSKDAAYKSVTVLINVDPQ